MHAAAEEAEERLLAMRVLLLGECSVADELSAQRETFLEQTRAVAAELGDTIWIEKLQLAVRGKRDLDAVLADGGPLAELLRTVLLEDSEGDEDFEGSEGDGTRDVAGLVPGLRSVLAELVKKLPVEARSGKDGAHQGLDLDDTEVLRGLLSDARELLIGRLLSGPAGGEP